MFNMILRIIPFLLILSLGFAKVNKSVTDIYTIENDTSYSLIIEHDSKRTIDYLVKEIFDPPTVFIEIKNLVWSREISRERVLIPHYINLMS